MTRSPLLSPVLLTVVLSVAALAGCSEDPPAPRVRTVTVTAVAGGCASTASELPAGETRFEVRNDRAEPVVFRVIRGVEDLGRAEVAPSSVGAFTAVLRSGELGIACGSQRAALTVYGSAP